MVGDHRNSFHCKSVSHYFHIINKISMWKQFHVNVKISNPGFHMIANNCQRLLEFPVIKRSNRIQTYVWPGVLSISSTEISFSTAPTYTSSAEKWRELLILKRPFLSTNETSLELKTRLFARTEKAFRFDMEKFRSFKSKILAKWKAPPQPLKSSVSKIEDTFWTTPNVSSV